VSFVRLAHLSDPHLPPPAGAYGWRDLLSKRTLSRIAWRRKHREHDPAVLDAMIADVRAQAPDHIAITGDLTNFAAPVEVEAARAWLKLIGAARDVTVSPGNHDALVGGDGPERFAAWAPWLGDGDETTFPRARVRGDIVIINLCSAVTTALHLAGGRLGAGQLTRLDALLAEHAGKFRILTLHHPPVAGAVSGRKELADQAQFRAVLARQGAELVLHGHTHEAQVAAVPGPNGEAIPVLGAPSASALGHGDHAAARWHLIEIEPGKAIRVIARGIEGGAVVELGRYSLDAAAI
jgi:3',5'-cyclic AMP phosphodiesterase CpdA